MSSWIVPSVVASAAATALLASVYLFLYVQDRKRYLLAWSASWGIYFTRFIFTLGLIFYGNNKALLIANQASALISGIVLLWGTYVFLQKAFVRFWFYGAALGVAWIIISVFFDFSFLLISLPTFLFLAIVYISTGTSLINSRMTEGREKKLTGWAFIIWGVYKASYPFLGPLNTIAPAGYLLGAVLAFAVALGMLLIYFKRARSKLQQSKDQLQTTLQTAMDGYWRTDTQGRLREVNDAYCKMSGYSASELLQMKIVDLDTDWSHEKVADKIQTVIQTGHDRFIRRHRRKSGDHFDVEVSAQYQGDDQLVCFIRDVTERRQILLQTESLLGLNQLVNATTQELADFTLAAILKNTGSEFGFIGFMSEDEQHMTLHTWSAGTMTQCRVPERPLHLPVAEAGIWGEAIRTRRPLIIDDYQLDHPAKRGMPQGHVTVKNYLGVPVFDGDRVVATAGLANRQTAYQDLDAKHVAILVTDMWKLAQRRIAETALAESGARYRTLFEKTASPIFVIDTDGNYLECNQAFCDFLETTRKNILSQNISDYIMSGGESILDIHRQSRKTRHAMETAHDVNGVVKVLDLVVTPLMEDARPMIFGLGNDITERRRAEDQLRERVAMIEQSTDAMIRTDKDFRIVYMNAAAEAMFGCPLTEAKGKTFDTFNADPDGEQIQDEICATVSAGDVYMGEHLSRRQNGETFYCQMKISPLCDTNGDVYGYMCSRRDVTKQKLAEQSITLTNDILNQLNRKDAESALFQNVLQMIQENMDIEMINIRLREEDGHFNKSAAEFAVDCIQQQRLSGAHHENAAIVKKEGAALMECISGRVLRRETDPALDCFTDGGSFRANSKAQLLSAINADCQADGRPHCYDANYNAVALVPLLADTEVVGLMQAADSRSGQFSDDRVQLLEHIGRLIGIAVSRINAEKAITNAAKEWRTTFDTMTDAIALVDKDHHIIRANRAMSRMFGLSFQELVGRECHQCVHNSAEPLEDCQHLMAMRDGQAHSKERYLAHLDKTFLVTVSPFFNSGEVVGSVHVMHDISLQKQAEAELQKHQKLESLGVLAGGIAHDFNNILSILWGNLQILLTNTAQDDNNMKFIVEAEKSCMRATELVKQLSVFSRGGAPVKEATALTALVREIVVFVLSGSKVKPRFSIPDDLPLVNVDPNQISQVLENLTINADQAMPGGGALEVSLTAIDHIGEGSDDASQLQPGRYLKISMRDHGIGIAENDLARIFDPYWTTKPKGSGLGLATCYSIINQHQGEIKVTSAPGEGTIVDIYLPAYSGQVASKSTEAGVEFGYGKVLVMDDEERLREIMGTMLKYLGYQADFAVDGEDAIAKYEAARASTQPHDAVLLDLTVPGGLGGVETIRELLKIDPEIKALVCSGYHDEAVLSRYTEYGFKGAVPKPVDIKVLSSELKKIIGP